MAQHISLNENGLSIEFTIWEIGVVELSRIAPDGAAPADTAADGASSGPASRTVSPLIELQVTGRSTREMHGYKHNASSASLDLHYVRHECRDTSAGRELVITLESEYGLQARYHMRLFKNIPVVQVTPTLIEHGIDISIKTQFSLWDSLMISAASFAKCTILYSEDMNDGQVIDGVTIKNPFV